MNWWYKQAGDEVDGETDKSEDYASGIEIVCEDADIASTDGDDD